MATKLDQLIGRIAIEYGRGTRRELIRAATRELKGLSEKEIVKLPDRDYGKLSAKLAGAPDLDDPWHHLWFESVLELLVQLRDKGLPGLLVLWERDTFTHHEFVLPALLRLAVDEVDADTIKSHVRKRLAELNYPFVRMGVMETFHWNSIDSRLLPLLRQFSDISVTNGDGETVGDIIERFITVEPIIMK